MGKTVHSQPDVLHVCLTSDPSRKRPVLVVCEVKKNEPVGNTPDHDNSPPKKKTRSLNTASPRIPYIPDSIFAPQKGISLFTWINRCQTRAVLGMTVDQTHVWFTLLVVNETT